MARSTSKTRPAAKTARKATKAKAPAKRTRREITEAHAREAIEMRESGAKWSEIIETVGFNGALLRPHMKALGFDPEAVVPTVNAKSTPKAIAADRRRGVALYALVKATGKKESVIRSILAENGVPAVGRVFPAKPASGTKNRDAASATRTAKRAAKTPVKSSADRKRAAKARVAKVAKKA